MGDSKNGRGVTSRRADSRVGDETQADPLSAVPAEGTTVGVLEHSSLSSLRRTTRHQSLQLATCSSHVEVRFSVTFCSAHGAAWLVIRCGARSKPSADTATLGDDHIGHDELRFSATFCSAHGGAWLVIFSPVSSNTASPRRFSQILPGLAIDYNTAILQRLLLSHWPGYGADAGIFPASVAAGAA